MKRLTVTLEKQDEKAIKQIQDWMGVSQNDAIRFALRMAGRVDFWDRIIDIAEQVKKSLESNA